MVPLRDRDRGEGVVLGVKCGENAAWKNFRPRLKIKSFSGRNEKFLGWFPLQNQLQKKRELPGAPKRL